MSTKELILKEIDEAPEEFSSEVLELIRALKFVKKHAADESDLDKKYHEYILQGIREGEEDIASGDVLDSHQANEYLEELLKK